MLDNPVKTTVPSHSSVADGAGRHSTTSASAGIKMPARLPYADPAGGGPAMDEHYHCWRSCFWRAIWRDVRSWACLDPGAFFLFVTTPSDLALSSILLMCSC